MGISLGSVSIPWVTGDSKRSSLRQAGDKDVRRLDVAMHDALP